jgi:predicted anti-sigma-YlaC factor YlaD
MSKIHLKQYFVDWSEGRLKQHQMDQIEQHLKSCPDCQAYFGKMQMFLAEPDPVALPELEPDYFLPTKIKELAKQSKDEQSSFKLWKKRIRVALGTATVVLALLIGVFFGKWMSDKQEFSETEIMLTYSTMFTDQGIGEVWNNVVTEENGEQQ